LGYVRAFQPYTYSIRPFSWGGGRQTQTPPQAKHRFRPPKLYRVKWGFTENSETGSFQNDGLMMN